MRSTPSQELRGKVVPKNREQVAEINAMQSFISSMVADDSAYNWCYLRLVWNIVQDFSDKGL